MAHSSPSLADLAAEEEELQFSGFTNDDAWDLGSALVAAARRDGAPVAVDVSRHGHQLFHASLPGTSPDNDSWIQRKTRVVHRFGHSTLYAAHGGAFPVVVRSVGPVGAVVVSGLPQLEDHRMVVAAIRAHLGL